MKSSLVERPPIRQGLPPIGDANARVLVLGSFPSEASLNAREYYAHSRNNFWPIMAQLVGFDTKDPYARRVDALIQYGIAVWDVIERCRRAGSMDQAIQNAEPNDLAGWLGAHPGVRGIAFNGGKAEDTARRNLPELFSRGDVVIRRMPSTSPANASIAMDQKMRAWSEIKKWAANGA